MSRLPSWLHTILLIAAGACSPFLFAPYQNWWATFLLFIFLFWSLDSQPKKLQWRNSFAFGFGFFAAGLSWVHVSIDVYGGVPLIFSLFLMSILAAYLALFFILAIWLSDLLSDKRVPALVVFPFAWVASEWLRSWFLTGFPWLSLGYSQMASPLAGWLPVIGEIGVTLLVVAICSSVLMIIKRQQVKTALAVIAFSVSSGIVLEQVEWVAPSDKTVALTIVQGNIAQETRWDPDFMWPTMSLYLDKSRPYYKQTDIVIWPEAAIPAVESYAQEYLDILNKAATKGGTAVVTGVVDFDIPTKHFYNSMIALGIKNQGETTGHYQYGHDNRYNKHHLLPIGEFVPFEEILRPLAPIFDLPHSSFQRGDYIQQNMIANGYHLLPALCYEIVFPDQIRDNIRQHTDFIVTLSNDAWFGDSIGPHQHLQIAQMRALEFGLPVVRVTNTGITAITDYKGNIVDSLPQFEIGVMTHELALVHGKTPYTWIGNWPTYGLTILVLLGLAGRKILAVKKQKSQSTIATDSMHSHCD